MRLGVVASSSLASHKEGAVEEALDRASAMIGAWQDDMVAWRRKIHAYPELAFEVLKMRRPMISVLSEARCLACMTHTVHNLVYLQVISLLE